MKIIRNILVASILFVCIQAQSQTLEEFRKTPIENSSHSDAVELEFPVLPEVPYEIFGSPDLKTWETLEAGITDETASANVGYLSDELHYNFGGEWALGHFAADVIRKNFEIGTEWQYPGQNSPMWITTNPFMTGETQSGLADGWQILTSSGVEVTTSKTPEGWQRISCTSGGQPGEIKSLRLRKFLSVTDDRLDGQDFQAVFDIRPASDGWNIWAASATISCSSSSPQIERIGLNPNISNPNILKLQTEIAPHTDRILFRTPVVTQPIGGIRLIVITLTILGEGTFDVVAGGAFRVVQ